MKEEKGMAASVKTGKEIMNRGMLLDKVCERVAPLGVTKKDADAVFRAVLTEIADALGAGYDVSIQGFGSFRSKTVPPREMKDSLHGCGVLSIPAKTRVAFKASGALREAAAGGD